MRNKAILAGVLAVIVIVTIIALAAKHSSTNNPTASPLATPATNASSPSAEAATITYDASGFKPAETTIKAGQAVTFVNASSETIQVDSDPHPIHTDDTELNIGKIASGQSQTVTLRKTGSFGLHNHLDPSKTARITIQ